MEKVLKSFKKYPYQIIAFFILGGHFLLLISFFEPAFSTPDPNGYFKQAQLIADHGRTWFQEESPTQYIGIHWMEAEGNRIYSRYPPGLPVIIAIPFKLFGPDAGILVNYILTTLTLLGLFVLCSMWIGKGWALVAIAAMACNPITNSHAVIGDSHTAAAFFLVWGIVFLARWSKSMSLGSAFLAGLLLGYIPTIRYPEALLGLGVALFILFHMKNNRKAWSSAAVAIIGATIPIVCLMVHNQIAFGAVWKTAYSLTGRTRFSLDYFSQNISLYLKNILVHGAGLLWIFGIAGLVILCVNKKTRKQGILFIVLVVPITLLYVSYYFMLGDSPFATMRFLLPTFYIYSIAGFWGLKIISNRWEKAATAMTITLLVVNTLWGAPQSLISMIILKDADASLAAVEKVVSENVKPGSFVIAPSHIQQHLDYLGHWRLMDDFVIEALPMIFLNELDRWNSPDREIYCIGRVEKMKDKGPPNYRLSIIKRIEPPQLVFLKIKTMFPIYSEQLDRLKDRFWNGLFRYDQFVANPIGIIRLIHKDGGLELVKWTRTVDS